jgi:broad specificity phosphatase PhoE
LQRAVGIYDLSFIQHSFDMTFLPQPLTARGMEQAKALGRISSWLGTNTTNDTNAANVNRHQHHHHQQHFHRICCSDLDRARYTAALTLGELAQRGRPSSKTITATTETATIVRTDTTKTVIPEDVGGDQKNYTEPWYPLLQSVSYTPELRELAKGPRQGFPKHWSLDEAVARRQQLSMTEPYPLLETDDDGWDRLSQWLDRQIRAAMDEAKAARTTTTTDSTSHKFHVLAFGHAGLFRVLLTRLLGEDVLLAHPDAQLEPTGRFAVPNASLTILDLHLNLSNNNVHQPENRIQKIDVILLTSTEHYNSV